MSKTLLLGFVLMLLSSCATTNQMPFSEAEKDRIYPKVSEDTNAILNLHSNIQKTVFYVNGNKIVEGKRVKVLINDRNSYTVVASPEGYKSKEEFIQPPYMPTGSLLSFTFMIEDKIGASVSKAAAQYTDVLVEGYDDAVREGAKIDREQALMNAKSQAIERAGVSIRSITLTEDFAVKKDLVESKAAAVLMPGYSVIDKGYQKDGSYLVILSGKVISKNSGGQSLDK